MLNTICVFCGSATGANPVYGEAAVKLAEYFSYNNIHLVYGGANVGLMGIIADRMLELGAKVTGVMPQRLVDKEVAHPGLTHMHIVKDMQERKAMMADLSDGFIALPGGYGTLDELFEMLSWHQLQITRKPVGVLNVLGFWDPMLKMLDKAVEEKFLRPEHHAVLQVDDNIEMLIRKMNDHQPTEAHKWIERLKQGGI